MALLPKSTGDSFFFLVDMKLNSKRKNTLTATLTFLCCLRDSARAVAQDCPGETHFQITL